LASSHTVEVSSSPWNVKEVETTERMNSSRYSIQSLESVPALSPALTTGQIITYTQSLPQFQPEMLALQPLSAGPTISADSSPFSVTATARDRPYRRRDWCQRG